MTFHNCPQITDASWLLIAEVAPQLSHLDLSCSNIGDGALIKIAKSCEGLQVLDLSEVPALSEDGLAHISFLTKLETLRTSHARGMTDRVLSVIVEGLSFSFL